MNSIENIKLIIWEREFDLPVHFDCYKNETILDSQKECLSLLCLNPDWIENSKCYAEKYCLEKVLEDEENDKKDNIFSYLIPKSVFIKRDEKHPRIALMCKYKYDLEHGLAVVFTSDGEISVGSQDIIL